MATSRGDDDRCRRLGASVAPNKSICIDLFGDSLGDPTTRPPGTPPASAHRGRAGRHVMCPGANGARQPRGGNHHLGSNHHPRRDHSPRGNHHPPGPRGGNTGEAAGLAYRCLAAVTARMPADREDWGRAMLAELGQIRPRGARWWFVFGAARVALLPPSPAQPGATRPSADRPSMIGPGTDRPSVIGPSAAQPHAARPSAAAPSRPGWCAMLAAAGSAAAAGVAVHVLTPAAGTAAAARMRPPHSRAVSAGIRAGSVAPAARQGPCAGRWRPRPARRR